MNRRLPLEPAIAYFHQLMYRDLNGAEQQLNELIRLQHQKNILFGGRAMATCLRPTFLSETLYTDVQDSVYLIRQAVLKIAAAFLNDRHVLFNDLGMEEWEVELAAIPTNVIRLSATARFDSFMTADSFKFVEINAEVPAGPAYLHHLGHLYRSTPIMQEFERRYPLRFVSPLEHLVANLVRTYHEEFDGRASKPAIAIVDLRDVPTYPEFQLLQKYLEEMGYACEINDPRELECRDGWIFANGRRIDILYRRLLMNEYYEIRHECPAYLEGYRAQKTCFLNSFRTKLVHKKAILALLTDEEYAHILDVPQLEALTRHIPWTRRLRERKTSFRGLPIDLVEFVRANRKYFVLKPNDAYGGAKVTLGFTCGQSEWDDALEEGLRDGHVVQERVEIHREPFLVKDADHWQEVPTVIDLDPYLNGPLMGGCLTRITAGNLANVTAGGGTLPCFILRYV